MASTKTSINFLLPLLISGFLYLEIVEFASCTTSTRNLSCMETERKALLNFKHGLLDPSLRLSSWVGKNCCRWEGVDCSNETGHVIKLELGNKYSGPDGEGAAYALEGEISASLLDLKNLRYLDLSMNSFGGIPIPEFVGSLKALRYLNLSGASFGGIIPPNLGNLSSLRYLDLNSYTVESIENDLQWLSGLSSLKHLNLGNVNLSKANTYWLHQALNMLPSLSELHLPGCGLSLLPRSLPSVNLTSLSVIDLSNNGFKSPIPLWLFNLTSLVYVDLRSNQFQGRVPDEFADLNFIRYIDLSSQTTLLGGKLPGKFGKLCNLRFLDLSFNNISGEIAEFTDGLSNCTNSSLEYLNLGYNELSGSLPDSLGNLRNLRELKLMRNPFAGSIPESIGNLSSLKEFYLSENGMRGTIPPSLGQLSSLVYLDLGGNQWEGVMTESHFSNLSSLKQLSIVQQFKNLTLVVNASSEWIPPFKLTFLSLKSCKLGPEFPLWLRNQNELNYVVLCDAKISGTIPKWFWELDLILERLDLSNNKFSGTVPSTIKFSFEAVVFLNANRFTGPLPLLSSNVSSLHFDDNLFSGPIPQDIGEKMPILTDLDVSFNCLNGRIPLSIGKLRYLFTLVLFSNQLTGKIPDFWNGLPGVYQIDLSNNNLTGEIPSSLGSVSVKYLKLSNNRLSGGIPTALQNCTELQTLDLGGNNLSGKISAWIGERLSSLFILRLRSNFFSGNIPPQLCSLSFLHILDLAHNNFSGSIPSCIGNLSGMASDLEDERYEGQLMVSSKGREYLYGDTLYLVNSIDLSVNNLSGKVPDLTDLSRLGILNLSMNRLTGNIPDSIGSLERLETLDLSMNQFNGLIPPSLTSATFLSHLNLSYNNLSGEIPSTNQFQTLNDPSIYQGNPALCGSPLPNKCNEDKETSHDFPSAGNKDNEDEDRDELETWLFYGTIALGFLVGFWGVCGSLIVKSSWRLAYFKFVDDIKDKLIRVFLLILARLGRFQENDEE